MITLEQLTEDVVARYAPAPALAQGRAWYQAGAVSERYLFNAVDLEAEVSEGRRAYNPQAHLEGDNLVADCECHDSRRAVCGHAVALLLAWIHEPASFERESDLNADDLADFDPDDAPNMEMGMQLPPAAAPRSSAIESPADAEREVAQMLGLVTVPQLRELAKRHGLAIGGNAREALVKPLAHLLSQRETVVRVWPRLSRPAQKLLGVLPLLRVNNLVYPQHAKQAFQTLDGKAAANFDTLLGELSGFGLVFGYQQHLINVPSPLAFYLPPDADFGPLPDDHARLKPSGAPPAPLEFVSMVTRLALMLKTNPDRFIARQWPIPQPIEQQVTSLAGWPHYPAELETFKYEPQAIRQLYAKSFGVPPAPSPVIDEARDELARTVGAPLRADRLDFALRLLIQLGIVKAVPRQPLSVDERTFNDWLAQPPLERAVILFAAYANLNTWTELDRLSDLHHSAPHLRHLGSIGYGQTYAATLGTLSVARGFLLLMLRRVPPDRWIDLEAFVARARAFHVNPNVWPLVHGVYLDLNGRQPNLATALDWQEVYGSFLETLLTGPLWWQGAVELATRLDRVVAFRLTAWGTRLFGQNLDYLPPRNVETRDRAAVTFLPNGDLVLQVEAASTDLLGLLTQVCEAQSDPAGQLIYRLSPAGVARLFESGWDAARLTDALRQSIGPPLPRAWHESIAQWWANFGALHLYADVAVIELADDYALNELLAGTSLARHLLYRFSPRLIAVRAEGVEELRSELVRKGYTPKTMTNDQ
jgi:hypothetical protein